MSSDYSDDDSVIIRHELDCAQDAIVSSSEDELKAEEPLIPEDKLLARAVGTSEMPETVETNLENNSNYVTLKQHNWGPHFDLHLATSLDKIQCLNDDMQNPSMVSSAEDGTRTQLMSRLQDKDVSPQYIDLVVKESISGRYIDWHFITQDTQFQDVSIEQEFLSDEKGALVGSALRETYPTLIQLLHSIGVSQPTLKSLVISDQKPLTHNRCHDTLCEMSPVDTMMRALEIYAENSELFLKYFLCFILDRKIWESMECNTHWCAQVSKIFTSEQLIDGYLDIVERRDYFMHYRLVRSLPGLQSLLVRQLLGPETTHAIVQEFEQLMDDKLYQPLLYFTLLIYGTRFMPFGFSPTTQYFKDCTEDLCNESTNAVELSLLRGILGIFLKVT